MAVPKPGVPVTKYGTPGAADIPEPELHNVTSGSEKNYQLLRLIIT